MRPASPLTAPLAECANPASCEGGSFAAWVHARTGCCDFRGGLFFGRNDRLGYSRLGIRGRWFHSTLFFFACVSSLALVCGLGLCSDLRPMAAFPLRRKRPNPERIPPRATVSALRHHGTGRSIILTFPAADAALLSAVSSRPLLRPSGSGFHGGQRHFHGLAHLDHGLLGALLGAPRAFFQNLDGLRLGDRGAPLLNRLQESSPAQSAAQPLHSMQPMPAERQPS